MGSCEKMFRINTNLPINEDLKERILKNIEKEGFNKGVTGILKLDDKYVFVVNQKKPFDHEWIFVSGGVEAGESSEDAISREVFEETGLTVINKEKIVNIGSIIDLLQRYRLKSQKEDILESIDNLISKEILSRISISEDIPIYQFKVDLVRLWLNKNHTMSGILEKVGKWQQI